MNIGGIIFDLDGTLVDTLTDISNCVNHSLNTLNECVRTSEEISQMVGDGVEALCRRALRNPTPDRILRMKQEMKRFYRHHPNETAAPYEGVPEMLESLRAHGLPQSVLSNKPHPWTEALVEKLFPNRLFAVVQGQEDDLPKKPDPTGAIRIARWMHLEPSRVLFVGDSEIDVRTGKAAGMSTVGASWGFRTRERLVAEDPDFILDHPGEIWDLIRTHS
jgi:phosphoglycolate phosphatase